MQYAAAAANMGGIMEIEWEEYIEEIKFQMTEYEEMTKEIILDWEAKADKWVKRQLNRNPRIKRRGDDILIRIQSEDDMSLAAEEYHNAVVKQTTEVYWKHFNL